MEHQTTAQGVPFDPWPDMPELVTVTEAAQYTRRGRRTVQRWVYDGRVPVYRLGRTLFLRKADLVAMLQPVEVNQ